MPKATSGVNASEHVLEEYTHDLILSLSLSILLPLYLQSIPLVPLLSFFYLKRFMFISMC